MIPFTSTGLPEPAAPVLSQDEFMRSAMDQPLSPMSTFFESVKGGALESYGLGTAIRDFGNAPLADVPENQPASTLGQALDMTINAFPPVAAYKAYRSGLQNVTGLDQPSPVLDKDAYERSPYKRTNIPWEPGMTEARAASLATWDDAKQVRDFYREKRPIASFLGGFTGQALDPINYIPVGGEFLAARAGLGIMGRAIVGSAIDAAGNTAGAGLGTASTRAGFGDDTSWQSMVSDIAMAGLIGAGFGTIGGAVGRRSAARAEAEMTARLGTLKRTQESRVALNEAIDGLINNDEVRLSLNGLAAVDNAADALKRIDSPAPTLDQLKAGQPFDSFDELYAKAPGHQAELGKIGKSIAADTGADFLDPGLKNRATAEAKVNRKGYDSPREMTDVIRGGFVVRSAEQASHVLQRLSETYRIFDEGWAETLVGYRDRKVLLQASDGTIAEIQMHEPNMLAAKKAGGHKLYQEARALKPGDPRLAELAKLQRELYSAASAKAGDFWKASEGSAGSEPNLDLKSALASTDAVLATSKASTDRQAPLSTAQASSPEAETIAGRPSQEVSTSRSEVDAFVMGDVSKDNIRIGGVAVNGTPRAEPAPEGLAAASGRVAKIENARALAEQHGVDPATGDFAEQADLDQVEAEGRLTEADRATLDEAAKTFEDGDAFAKALSAAVSCII